jgi:hypothetical protein
VCRKDPFIAKLYEDYSKLLKGNICNFYMLDLTNSTLLAAKHQLNKIIDLKLDGPAPDFAKAHKLLDKMDGLIKNEKCAKAFNDQKQYDKKNLLNR